MRREVSMNQNNHLFSEQDQSRQFYYSYNRRHITQAEHINTDNHCLRQFLTFLNGH